jgi:rare lipoprotein A
MPTAAAAAGRQTAGAPQATLVRMELPLPQGVFRRAVPGLRCLSALLLALCAAVLSPPAQAELRTTPPEAAAPSASKPQARPLDHSGRIRRGIASFYSRHFAGKPMANGEPMNPRDDNAASKTLPLGTRARVTNLENGRSTTVTIEDRGPYVKGRIIDVSPATAQELGIERKEGLAKVEVAPLTVPQPDGSVKPGAGLLQR